MIKFWYGGKKHEAKDWTDADKQIDKFKADGVEPYKGLLSADEAAAALSTAELLTRVEKLEKAVSKK